MANNRMYLVCPECNEGIFLGKRLGSSYYNGFKLEMKELNDFFDKHAWCGEKLQEGLEVQYEFGDAKLGIKEIKDGFKTFEMSKKGG